MATKKIRKSDIVVVVTGEDKRCQGKVLKISSDGKVLIEGVHLVKKHVKPNPNKNEQGGVLERESGIHISNVAVYNPAAKKPDWVKIKILDDGTKIRVFASNRERIDV
ncbi:50S ribosomal protein L24 [Coxiella endosymbiont of Amblyomma sculptum]|uniref:50S ribosomal protein L24 n=1 Tax=Coxiella endosymbiont of Amblyomma sculptum TaxID=2487929 RepID=UPI00132EC340|nr:50S ribosomal protein L24 [Coxiella endosymbiont of Amblyomma sculptum]QHG92448.1 50S ribosomal protein L24 [Coxiella endosymbiont of Amblyomma sculptum]